VVRRRIKDDDLTHVGVTATQDGLTKLQRLTLRNHMRTLGRCVLHHGDCIGGDSQAHFIARCLDWRVELHPPDNPVKRAWSETYPGEVTHAKKPYLDRNKDIVLQSKLMLACPAQFEEQLRSGTWSTIRFARKQFRPLVIFYPDGSYVAEVPQRPPGMFD
jgi:hypothetical protein